jgi:hypothetical protein
VSDRSHGNPKDWVEEEAKGGKHHQGGVEKKRECTKREKVERRYSREENTHRKEKACINNWEDMN